MRYMTGPKPFIEAAKLKPCTSKSARILVRKFRKAYPKVNAVWNKAKKGAK